MESFLRAPFSRTGLAAVLLRDPPFAADPVQEIRQQTMNGGDLRLIFLVTLVGIAGALILVAATPGEEATAAGRNWLALLDDQKYEESWNQAGSMFREQVPQQQWTDALKKSREPLGSLVSRTASRVQLTTSLRGAPDGEYVVIHFTTSLRNKSITERLTLVKERDRWRVAAYAIH